MRAEWRFLPFIAIAGLLSVTTKLDTAPLTKDNQPIAPFRITDNLYYMGSSDIAGYLITTKKEPFSSMAVRTHRRL